MFSQSGDIFVGDIAAGENRGENVVRAVRGDKGVKEVLYLSEEQQELKGSLSWHTLTNHHLLRTTLATWSAQLSCHCSRAPCTLATGRKYEESTAPTSRLGKRASDESL